MSQIGSAEESKPENWKVGIMEYWALLKSQIQNPNLKTNPKPQYYKNIMGTDLDFEIGILGLFCTHSSSIPVFHSRYSRYSRTPDC